MHPDLPHLDHGLLDHGVGLVRAHAAEGWRPIVELVRRHRPDAEPRSLEEEDARFIVARVLGVASWAELRTVVGPEKADDARTRELAELAAAITRRDLAGVRTALHRSPGLMESGSWSAATALATVVAPRGETSDRAADRAAICATLLDTGVDPDSRPLPWRETALMGAVSVDDHVVASLLLEAGADVDACGAVVDSGTALDDAVFFGVDRCIPVLLERGARVYDLRLAAALGDTERMATFFDGPRLGPAADDHPDRVGDSPRGPDEILAVALSSAASNGHLAALEMLLSRGADPDRLVRKARFDEPANALHCAATWSSWHLVERLLDHGADVTIRDGWGGNALDGAIYTLTELDLGADDNFLATVELLLKAGLEVTAGMLERSRNHERLHTLLQGGSPTS